MPKPSSQPGKGTPGKVDDTITADSSGRANALPGDDTVIHVVGAAAGSSNYKGGAGIDTLELQLTSDEWLALAPSLQQELDDFLAFLDATVNPTGQATGQTFTFDSLGLTVKQFEAVRLVVDGVEISPNDDPVDAVDDSFDVLNNATLSGSVLGNDSVPDLVANVSLLSGPSSGSLTFNSDGSFDFDPGTDFDDLSTGQFRDVTFTYEVTDANGDSDTAEVTITVEGTNIAPVAVDDSAVVDEDGSVTVSVLLNDADADGDALSISAASDGANGSISIDPAGTITYTPDADFNGTDSFTYTVSDGNGGTDTGTVNVTVNPVNDAPAAVDDTATMDEDTTAVIDVLGNDSDVDGDSLTVVSVGGAVNGTVDLTGGVVTFTPDADYNGPASFKYQVSDGNGGVSTADANITVLPVNDAPIANDDFVSMAEDTVLNFDVVGNDTDVDGDTLTVAAILSGTINGVVTLESDGSITFAPDADFNGIETFSYKVVDGNGGEDTATVTVSVTPVNDAPIVGDTTILLETGDSAVVDLAALVTDIDSIVDPNLLSVDDSSTLGSLVPGAPGTAIYTAPPNGTGSTTDTFEFTFDDNGGLTSNTGTVFVNVYDTGSSQSTDSDTLDNGQTVSLFVETDATTIDGDTALSVDITRSELDDQVVNVSLVIDASGSVGTSNYVQQLLAIQATAAELVNNFGGTGIEVNLQLTRFSRQSEERSYTLTTDSVTGESYFLRESGSGLIRAEDLTTTDPNDWVFEPFGVSLTEPARLDQALSQAIAIPTGSFFPAYTAGWTDYTSALKQVETFFAGTDGQENFMLFISDGRPLVPSSLVPGGIQDSEWQPIITGLKTGPAAVVMDAVGFGGVVGDPIGQAALNFIDDDATADFLTSASQLTSALSASPLFSAEVVDFDVFLSVNGGAQTVAAGDGLDDTFVFDDSILSANGANFEFDLASLTGLSSVDGDVNTVTVRVRFDEDGDLLTTGDQRVLEATTTILGEDVSGLFA